MSLCGPGAALGQSVAFGGGPGMVTAVSRREPLLQRVSDAGLERIARTRPEIWRALAGRKIGRASCGERVAISVVAVSLKKQLASRLPAIA